MSEDHGPPPASEKQTKFIASLQRRIGLTDDELEEIVKEVTDKESVQDVTIREASELIDELQTQARERGVDLDSQPKASEKQVKFIKSLKRRAHLTEEEFKALLEEQAGVSEAEEVGRRDASGLIDHLLGLANADKGGGSKKKAKKKKAKADPDPAPPPPEDDGEEYDDDVPF